MADPSGDLLDAVVELLAEHGYEGISIRRVADRAGVSIGAVQHHFRTKDALLDAAMGRVGEQVRADLARRADAAADARQALRAVALGLVPLTDAERPAGAVWLAQVARAAVHEEAADRYRAMWRAVEAALADRLRAAAPGLGDDAAGDEAAALLALLDGLAAARVAEPARMPAGRARRLVDAHLDRVLTAWG